MRKKVSKQPSLIVSKVVDHQHAIELEAISKVLEENPIITEMVFQDLSRDGRKAEVGAEGMSAEQVLRAAVIKQMEEFSYEQLAFHIGDSISYRRFCGIGIADKVFKKSALCRNIKMISPETWEATNSILIGYSKEKGIEKGKQVRIDSTVVNSNIHDPKDSIILWDCVRVLSRLLKQGAEEFEQIVYNDHTKRAKRRMLEIENAKDSKSRDKLYEDLLKVTAMTLESAQKALEILEKIPIQSSHQMLLAIGIASEFKHFIPLTLKVIDQTERRIVHGEKVPATEKIVSIFEPHTDVIVKDRRDTYYGHKVFLSGGSSNLITDCVIVEGNPADKSLTQTMLERHKQLYGSYPEKAAFDGGFASKENLKEAKAKGINNVCFTKRLGMGIEQMCQSEYVYKRLRKFRAGIESGISWIKRSFGFATCTWKSFRSFKSYVWVTIVSANLVTIARQLAKKKKKQTA